jgi:hypothetical protein
VNQAPPAGVECVFSRPHRTRKNHDLDDTDKSSASVVSGPPNANQEG